MGGSRQSHYEAARSPEQFPDSSCRTGGATLNVCDRTEPVQGANFPE